MTFANFVFILIFIYLIFVIPIVLLWSWLKLRKINKMEVNKNGIPKEKEIPWFRKDSERDVARPKEWSESGRGTGDTGRHRDPTELPEFRRTDGHHETGTTETGKSNYSDTRTNEQPFEQLRSDTTETTNDKRTRVQVPTAERNNSDEIGAEGSSEQDWPSFE